MNILTKATALALTLGLSSAANAGLIDLTGNINIEGFHHAIGDNDMTTFALHITDLDGSLLLDPGGIGSFTGGSATLGGLPLPAPSSGGVFLSLLNAGLNGLPPAAFGTQFDFGSTGAGAGFGATSTTLPPATNVPFVFSTPAIPAPVIGGVSTGTGVGSHPINTSFDSIIATVSGNTLDIAFDEAGTGQFGSIARWLFSADSSTAGLSLNPNNGSFSSSFNLNNVTTSPVPVPAAVWLLGSGLMGLIGISRRKTETV